VIDRYAPETPAITFIERFAFYERTKDAFAVVMTGDMRKYANLILKKGVS
jgi:L-fucose mutarotase